MLKYFIIFDSEFENDNFIFGIFFDNHFFIPKSISLITQIQFNENTIIYKI